jgi:hypothetical protein
MLVQTIVSLYLFFFEKIVSLYLVNVNVSRLSMSCSNVFSVLILTTTYCWREVDMSVVKETDLKSVGLRPRRFEPCCRRLLFFCVGFFFLLPSAGAGPCSSSLGYLNVSHCFVF